MSNMHIAHGHGAWHGVGWGAWGCGYHWRDVRGGMATFLLLVISAPPLLLHLRCAGLRLVMSSGSTPRRAQSTSGVMWSAVHDHLSRWSSPRSIPLPHRQ